MKRTSTYLGPGLDIERSDLASYEIRSNYVIEAKVDGMWCELTVGDPARGIPHQLNSRDGTTDPISGSNLGDIHIQPIPLPPGSIIIGELEAATEWATEQAQKRGFRRLHLFDIYLIMGGFHLQNFAWKERYELLRSLLVDLKWWKDESRFTMVPLGTEKFERFYDSAIEGGYEGVVLKPTESLYRTTRSDRKTKEWARCKRIVTSDFVLCGIGSTPGGKYSGPKPTGLWGLYKNGVLTEVMQAAPPHDGLLQKENIGKLVVEFMGWARFNSGALRHAQAVRIRTDKTARMCTL